MESIVWNSGMNAIIRLLLKGMFVSVVCLAQQRTAFPEDAAPKRTSAKEAESTELRTHFSFKKTGKLISRAVDMPEPGPYYTCLVKKDQVDRFPYEYALYFSTDHDRGKGGIWLYVAGGDPTDTGSWKSYDQAVANGDFDYLQEKPDGNPIFFDSVQGRQTEFMEEHEMLAPNVSRTVYSDGSEILANHSNADFVYKERTVRSLSYILVEPAHL